MDCSNPAVIKAKAEGMPLHGVRRKPRILLGVSGCVDVVKFGLLCEEFSKWAKVGTLITESSLQLIETATTSNDILVYKSSSSSELLLWADIMVIAPLSAHNLSLIAKGLYVDLLTNIVRGWNHKKPFFVAPLMHRFMWQNPFTAWHLKCIEELGITVIKHVELEEGSDAGEYEIGPMFKPSEISYTVKISHEFIWEYYTN